MTLKEYNPMLEAARKAEQIRKAYQAKGHAKFDKLQELDKKVRLPGTIISSVAGVLGALITSAGMAYMMVWGNTEQGLSLGIPGMILMLLAYPLYRGITGSRRKKYARQIQTLRDEIMKGGENNQA